MEDQLTQVEKKDRILIQNSKDIKIFAFDFKLFTALLISCILLGIVLIRIELG